MKIGCVILAAGAGARLGGVNKAALRVRAGGPRLLESIIGSCRQHGLSPLKVVVGPPFQGENIELFQVLGVDFVVNPRTHLGMASSIARGYLELAKTEVDAGLLWPTDHAWVTDSALAELLAMAHPNRWISPRVAGRGGHPVVIGRAYFEALADCAANGKTAREVRDAATTDHVWLEMNDQGMIRDVDCPSDLP